MEFHHLNYALLQTKLKFTLGGFLILELWSILNFTKPEF